MKCEERHISRDDQEAVQAKEQERQKSVAFVFACGVEKDNPLELDKESKQRLEKAAELYSQDKVDRFVLCGGRFAQGMETSAAELMKKYLVENYNIPGDVIMTESRSKDTTSNVRFGRYLIDLKDLNDLSVYYISGDEHLVRIKDIVAGQEQKPLWLNSGSLVGRRIKLQPHLIGKKHFVSSGEELSDGATDRIFKILSGIISKADPHGKSKIARLMRKGRTICLTK